MTNILSPVFTWLVQQGPLRLSGWIAVASFLIMLLFRILLVGSYAVDLGGIEQNVIFSISKVVSGEPLYQDPERFHYDITQYTPIYYLIVVALAKIFGLQSLQNAHDFFVLGRSVSLFFDLAGVIFLWLFLRRKWQLNTAWCFVICALEFYFLTRIHFATRPDSLFALVSLATVLYVLHLSDQTYIGSRVYSWLWVSLLACLALFTKQTGMVLPPLVVLFLFLRRLWKPALVFSFGYVGLFAIGYFTCRSIWGDWFWKNTFEGIRNGLIPFRAYDVFSHYYLKSEFVFALALFSILWMFRFPRNPIVLWLGLCNLVFFCFAFLTSMKEGSWINYYQESIMSSLLFLGFWLRSSADHDFQNPLSGRLGWFACLSLMIFFPAVLLQKLMHEHMNHVRTPKSVYDEPQRVASWMNAHLSAEGRMFSTNVYVNIMMPKRAIFPNLDLVPSQSPFQYRDFEQAVAQDKIQYIVHSPEFSGSSFLNVTFPHADVLFSGNNFKVIGLSPATK